MHYSTLSPPYREHPEQLYRALVESVKDYAIFFLDPQGVIQTWNRGACRIKGYRSDEIIGQHFSILYTPQEQESGKPAHGLNQAIQQGHYEDEGWRVRKDQSQFWANVIITPVYEGRKLVGFSKVTRDLTERRSYENALSNSVWKNNQLSELLQTVVNNSPAGIVLFAPMLNAEGGLIDFRYKLTNQTHARVTGQPLQQLQENSLLSLFPLITFTPFWHQLLTCYQTSLPRPHQENYTNGQLDLWIDGTFVKQGDDVLWVFQDVTELKRTQSELEQKIAVLQQVQQQLIQAYEREQEMNLIKTEFVKLVAHQFRTPMTSMLLNAEILKRHAERTSEPVFAQRVVDYSQQVVADIQRLNKLISKVFIHERMHQNQIELQSEPLELVAWCTQLIQQQLRAQDRQVVFHKTESEIRVEVDPILLEQVVENLLSNALKYSIDSDRPVELTLQQTSNGCLLSVKDYGIGIPTQEIKHLTKSFFRASNTANYPGTGLGLSLSQQIIQMHGGQLTVESEENHYTLITIRLPLP